MKLEAKARLAARNKWGKDYLECCVDVANKNSLVIIQLEFICSNFNWQFSMKYLRLCM